jgi:hypothetical protein
MKDEEETVSGRILAESELVPEPTYMSLHSPEVYVTRGRNGGRYVCKTCRQPIRKLIGLPTWVHASSGLR